MPRVLYTLFCRFFEIIFGVLLLVITARLFGAEGRGQYSAGLAATTMFGVLCSFNLSRGIYSVICSDSGAVDECVRKHFFSICVLGALAGFIGLLAYGTSYFIGFGIFQAVPLHIAAVFAFYVPCLIWSGISNTLYSSLGQLTVKNNINVASKFLFLVLAAIMYWLGVLSLAAFCALFVVFSWINAVSEAFFLKWRYSPDFRVLGPTSAALVRSSIAWYPDLVGGFMISGAVSAIVAYYLPLKSIGIFGVAMQVFTIGFTVVPAVLQSYVSQEIARVGARDSIGVIYRYIAYYSVYFFLAYFLLITAGEYVSRRVLGDEFVEVTVVLRTMAIAGWMNGVVLLLAPLWTAMRYIRFTTASTLVLGGISLAILIFLTSGYGLRGVSWAMVVIYGVAALCNLLMLRHAVFKLGCTLTGSINAAR